MKLLILSRYGSLGASSRLRTLAYIPEFEKRGIEVTVSPFFPNDYLENLYMGRKTKIRFILYLINRVKIMRKITNFDVVWVEKECIPWMPFFVENSFFKKNVNIIMDYDDAIFHRYDQHKNFFIRVLLGKKICSIMSASSTITAGNKYLADYAKSCGSEKISTVPTVVNLTHYNYKIKKKEPQKITIGWIGTPSTWQQCVMPIWDIIEKYLEKSNCKFISVGAKSKPETYKNIEHRIWTEENEVKSIQDMDIGIMPLPDTPWMRGKCGYKLIQYMACGIPVVASPVGVNSIIVEHGINGYLVNTEEDWNNAFTKLIENKDLRNKFGAAGREKVEQTYSLSVVVDELVKIIAKNI